MTPQFENLRYERRDGRARITLNRPEKRNALSTGLLRELHDALWQADEDTTVHAVVISGAGRGFSAGYDLSPVPAASAGRHHRRGMTSIDDDAWQMEQMQRFRMAIFDMHKPVIAQVHGHCLAGGTDIALLCDLVIAAEDAFFGFPPARDLGSLPNQMWIYHVGPQWAKRLLLTGDTISGADAAKIGLVLKAVPGDLLETEVDQLCDRLALIDPDLLSANKRIVNLGLELMGARTLQRLAVETDARAHRAASARTFAENLASKGVKAAIRERDEKFGDSRVRVDRPEIRDESGNFVD